MQFVIAGEYREFSEFLDRSRAKSTASDYIFISDPTRLYKTDNAVVLAVGSYWKSPVYYYPYLHKIASNVSFINESNETISMHHSNA